jgi:hypothetical protein
MKSSLRITIKDHKRQFLRSTCSRNACLRYRTDVQKSLILYSREVRNTTREIMPSLLFTSFEIHTCFALSEIVLKQDRTTVVLYIRHALRSRRHTAPQVSMSLWRVGRGSEVSSSHNWWHSESASIVALLHHFSGTVESEQTLGISGGDLAAGA